MIESASDRNSDSSVAPGFHSDLGDPPDSPPYASPASSPEKPPGSTVDNCTQCSPETWRTQGQGEPNFSDKPRPPMAILDRSVTKDNMPPLTKWYNPRSSPTAARIIGSRVLLQRVALGIRVCEFILCLIAFSVMAADRSLGWSGDSFDRYKEYRYCLAVNVIGFVYSGYQTCDLAYYLMTGKPIILHHFRSHIDFFMDQILAYLLISASSSAATRVDDWESNWGKDKFTEMASASVSMSFLAFSAFAISSLISGYFLFNPSQR